MDGLMDRLTDGHMDVQRETIIPRHYRVAGYKKGHVTISPTNRQVSPLVLALSR